MALCEGDFLERLVNYASYSGFYQAGNVGNVGWTQRGVTVRNLINV